MFYVTGDRHGDFRDIPDKALFYNMTKEDTIIVLGDNGLNFTNSDNDLGMKRYLLKSELKPKLFCMQGNHDCRPEHVKGYELMPFCGGAVWYQKEFPNLLFPVDGEIFNFDGKTAMVCGGAYSADKFYRLERGYRWYPDEQPDDIIKARTEKNLAAVGWNVDYMLTHTTPIQYEPVEMFASCIDTSTVDKTTEIWLGDIEKKTKYTKWYCGHYHTNKDIDKITFLFQNIVRLGAGYTQEI